MINRMISKKTAEHYNWGGDCEGWHLLKSESLSVIHERMPPGRNEISHRHDRTRQLFFVLSGTLTMVFDDHTEQIASGRALEVAPGIRHQAANRSRSPIEFLVISQPPTKGDRTETP